MTQRTPTLILAGLLFHCGSFAADDFPVPRNAGEGAEGLPLAAEEAAAGFRLPPGFRAQVFAAEPDVQNPVAMTWDNRGRLWVAECYTYANRPTKYDLTLRDRVIILADRDGDGRAEERKVFCDNVQQLMSVEVGLGGVWLIALPRVLFIPDRNGDDVPDGPPEVVLDGFETSTENYHNCANGLKWGPDGWLYGRCGASSPGWIGPPGSSKEQRVPIYGGIWRYHPTRKVFEVLCHGFTNPWGHDWDAYGEMFITNTVTGHLFHLMPGAHHTRSATITPNRYVYEPIDSHADHFHWDTGKRLKDTAGLGIHDSLGGGHAHCGAMIYLGENWPAEYRGKLMTLNLHGRRINVDRIEREGSGYVARHESDMAQAADMWFRGIDLNYGPDGAVYVIDWSDTGECHEHDGIHRLSGRVFRISYGERRSTQPFDLTRDSAAELVALHYETDEWLVRHARRELADRAAAGKDLSGAINELRAMQSDVASAIMKLRATWTLKTLDALPKQSLIGLLEKGNEHWRVWGLRLLTDFWPRDTVFGKPYAAADTIDPQLVSRLVELAKAETSGLVRLTLASILQRLPVERRSEFAAALLGRAEDASDHNLPKLIWYGLIPVLDRDPAALVALVADGKMRLTRQWMTRALAEDPVKNSLPLHQLLSASLDKDEHVRGEIVQGLAAGLAGRRKAEPPPAWQAFLATFVMAAPEVREQVRGLAVIFGDGVALDEVRRVALDDRAKVPERRAALETLIEARPDDLRQICERLLRVRFLNTAALKGLTLFDDAALGEQLARSYNSFHPVERPAAMEALVSRPTFARALLDQLEAGRIPASDLSALHARQIRSFGEESLTARLAQVWGELRDSPEDKQAIMASLKTEMTRERLLAADARQGRAAFHTTCANCHRLFGAGGTIAPDLTGSGRHNLDYLLQNIVDPSAVVNKDFRMSVLRMNDGRVLNGLVLSQDEERVVLQTAKDKLTLMRSEIDEVRLTTLSPMPEGMLQPLKPDQVRDLIAYLMSPGQVELPVGFDPGIQPAGEPAAR
jgi:putative membrane-bound dehydrogenase-like protein